ncbi:hypothetical protein BO99DRAFT_447902 [Aspergillus violaceofuscus CBS 115571]|uniref:BTB domain-containing protein n=1 Tax=Aspergillus violaceofuscus (strain CBS 115571) TaxID=1450538 RepID=A0A2V5GXX9_ASPV1|nr:hypothetical protein BO99DRAFT_447902 [Aspergillus violaceofuscus CBS 115571]
MSNNPGMFEDAKAGELCDLVLECDGVRLTVHKLVVWNQSEVIKTACRSNFMEGHTNVVPIPGFSLVTVKRMVEYMYLGDYSLDKELKWDSELAQTTTEATSDSLTAAASSTSPDTTSTESAEETTDRSQKVTNPAPPTIAEALRPHLEMSMIAGYYIIPALETLALEKIKATSMDLTSHLRAMVVQHLGDFPSNEVLFPDPFSRNVVSMLRHHVNEYKKRALASAEQTCDANAKRVATETQVRQLKNSLDKLGEVNRCRHCKKPFFGHVKVEGNDNLTCKLQCTQCDTRHA